MALILTQPGVQPLGQYDGSSTFAPKGGEVGVLQSIGVNATGNQILTVRAATTGDTGPFFLVDDGTAGYGTLFGNTVVRTSTGFTAGSYSGVPIGPPTYTGSGKLTLWDKPGLYAVTLDALIDSEATLKAASPGAGLTVDPATGKLMLGDPAAGSHFAKVITFKFDEGLVTTGGAVVPQKKLVIAFNGYVDSTI
jgi:hypothetical protein